ncbi:MAG: hypothetical protein MUE72_08870, partial [Chitinophagaceae bacterium]|nr:hypothetical protein [Chitinophagaceae bacterium]
NEIVEFEVTANTQSQGSQRFQLLISQLTPIASIKEGFNVYPTNTKDGNVTIASNFTNKAATFVRILSLEGKLLHTINFGDIDFIQQSINIPIFAKGNILIQLVHGKESFTKQVIKN